MTERFDELRKYNLWDGNAIEREYSSLEAIADNYEKIVASTR